MFVNLFRKLIENHRSQLYKLTIRKKLDLRHPEVIKKSEELDQLIHVYNALTLNREVDVRSVLNKIFSKSPDE